MLEWIHWVNVEKTWDDARANCINNYAGDLFDNINGTREQLDFMFEKLNRRSFWLGVTYDVTAAQWKKLDGSVVPQEFLITDWGQPLNGAAGEIALYARVYNNVFGYLQDSDPNYPRHSACDLNL